MATGLMRRYGLAKVPPPQLIYVDREWERLVVRLDIWHLMRRFSSGGLTQAKQSELEGKHGMVGLTDADVIQRVSKEEWRLHCRRRTRGAEETALLIQDLLDTFNGPAGRHLEHPEAAPQLHPGLAGVQLYTETGRLTKGGVSLPVYCCARGSTSLESFHLHLQRFIPGTSTRPRYFQAFRIDGQVRWNEDRAAAAAPPPAAEDHLPPLHSYSGHLKHALNQKSQRVLGHHLVKDFTKPTAYTGELIGVEYLFQQTGSVLERVSGDPDAPDEAAAVIALQDEDEGMEEDEDPTISGPVLLSSDAAARSGDPADTDRSEPSGPSRYLADSLLRPWCIRHSLRMV
ncbi:uncharacterized protein LOC118599933 [Oryzias melastigma]|uniref:uncharacterized protein LOC118599933 n=1 Tax=Oryzias melastigma TaxID=30732 RepID=UPI00168D0713|nr:uncharacterized protein LOC118599933 [Oryzias melastigma]